jgi:serine/threonine protein kinase/WD40 repeat protein
MEPNLTLDEAVRRWQTLKDQGKTSAVDDLCSDCPEGAEDLSARHQAVASMAAFLGIEPDPEFTRGGANSSSALPSSLDEHPLDLPGYEVLGELGRGGMGVVYLARQLNLGRVVALKRILTRHHATPAQLARFRNEARAVAQIRHPNIVQVHEVGEHDGLPYITFEYIRGGSLDRRLTGTPLSPETAARLVELLSRAVHAAHERGVVHRDLKPGNILLDDDGTHAQGLGIPKVTDFGLAKLLNTDSNLTMIDSVMGSPSYMAPEQAEGKVREVGPPADVYAMGAILYELLTGRPPFRGASVLETLQQVKASEPAPPSRLVPGLDRDIETIALKCLEKEPSRRFATAAALADDLDHYCRDEPIAARPVGRGERAWRWCRRNPVVAGLCAAVTASLLLGSAISLDFAVQVSRLRSVAQKRLVDLSTSSGQFASRQRDDDLALLWFARAVDLAGDDAELSALNRTLVANWSRHAAHPVRSFAVPGFRYLQDRFRAFDFHPAGRHLLTLTDAGRFDVWDLESGVPLSLPEAPAAVTSAAWSPAGDRLAVAVEGGIAIRHFPGGEPLDHLTAEGTPRAVAFSPDGRSLAWGGTGGARVFDLKERRWATPPLPHPREVVALAFSRSAGLLATACGDRKACVFDVPGGPSPRLEPLPHIFRLHGYSHGGLELGPPLFVDEDRRLVTLDHAPSSTLCRLVWTDLASGSIARSAPLPEVDGNVTAVTLSPDGRLIAVGSQDRVLMIDAVNGKEVAVTSPGNEWTEDVTFDPAGQAVVSCGHDTTARLWSTGGEHGATGIAIGHPIRHPGMVVRARISPGDRLLATAQWDGRIVVWSLPRGTPLRYSVPIGGRSLIASSPDGRYLLASGTNYRTRAVRSARVLNASDGTAAGLAMTPGGLLIDAAFSPDGRTLATLSTGGKGVPGSQAGTVQFWDWGRGERRFEPLALAYEPRGLAFRPDGGRLAVACADGGVTLVDPRNGALVSTLKSGNSQAREANFWTANGAVTFSPDGSRLATWGIGSTVVVWDASEGRLLHRLPHSARVISATFGADRDTFATGGRDCQARIWDLSAGRPTDLALRHPQFVEKIDFVEEGRRVMTAADDGHLRVWDPKTGLLLEDLTLDVRPYDFGTSSDGRFVVAAGVEGLTVLDRRSGSPLAPRLPAGPNRLLSVAISSDGSAAVATGLNGELRGYPLADLGRPDRSPVAKLRLLAEVASSHRVDDSGRLIRLTGEQWADRWRQPGSHDPRRLGEILSDLAALHAEGPTDLDKQNWRIVRDPGCSMEEYLRALTNAVTACRNAPTEGTLTNTLGAAYYRTGRYDEALAAMTRSAELKTRGPGDPTPRDLAFVAMTQFRLGKTEKARETADRLFTVMADPRWKSDAESIALLSETTGLLGVSGPGSKTGVIENAEHRKSGAGGISLEYLTPERKDRNLLRNGLFGSSESPWQRRSWREDEVPGAKPYVPGAASGDQRPPHLESEVADDVSLGQVVAIKPGRRYVFSGWCKTENVVVMEKPGNVGANLSILGGYERSASLVGTNGWTFLSMVFDAKQRTNVAVAVRLGHHYSTATGRAWFDDLCLIELESGHP